MQVTDEYGLRDRPTAALKINLDLTVHRVIKQCRKLDEFRYELTVHANQYVARLQLACRGRIRNDLFNRQHARLLGKL